MDGIGGYWVTAIHCIKHTRIFIDEIRCLVGQDAVGILSSVLQLAGSYLVVDKIHVVPQFHLKNRQPDKQEYVTKSDINTIPTNNARYTCHLQNPPAAPPLADTLHLEDIGSMQTPLSDFYQMERIGVHLHLERQFGANHVMRIARQQR